MTTDATWDSEQLILCSDEGVGLHAVIAIDDTTLGPGLGGVRMRAYPSADAGIRECRRLAAGMTRKNAVAEVPYGGAKSVILVEEQIADRAALMRRFGEFVARAGGAYLPGVDMGTCIDDLAVMGEAGAVVSCSTEDPSPHTAVGVHSAIRAAVAHVDPRDDLEGVSVLVQGAGHVGAALARGLAREGARVMVSDVDKARADALAAELGTSPVDPAAVIATRCDVFAPCAVAGVLDRQTIPGLDCRIVAGAANEVLAEPACADLLAERGIVYVPDFVANAGGVIDIHALRSGWGAGRLHHELELIGERTAEILQEADATAGTPLDVAEARAARRLAGSHSLGTVAA